MQVMEKNKTGQSNKISFLDKIKEEIESEKPQKPLDIESIENAEKEREKYGKKFKKHKNRRPQDDETFIVDSTSVEDSHIDMESDKKLKLSKAEQKRLESLKERNVARDNQKKLIKMSIQSKPVNNKIKFEDSDEETVEYETQENEDKKQLFESDDSDNDIAFNINDSKSKLIKTKVSAVDERFRMDSKFFDDDNRQENNEKEMEVDEERDKMLNIANSIIGKEIKVKKKIDNQTIPTRFDPLSRKHKSLIIKKDEDIEEEPVKKKEKVKKYKVSSDQFYEVSDKLKEQFINPEEKQGFSLLNLFGGKVEDIKTVQNLDEKVNNKKIVLKNPLQNGIPNFFNIDEESDTDDDNNKIDNNKKNNNKTSIFETLFIKLDDPRIEEALDFFNKPPENSMSHAAISSHLRKIVKKKHLKNASKNRQFKTKLILKRKFKNNKKKKDKSQVKS